MHWVILTDDFPPVMGGVATFTLETARALREAGHQVRVFTRARPGMTDATAVWGPSFGRRGGTWLGLRALVDMYGADAILATTWPVATLAARVLGERLHVVAHGSDVTRPPVRPRAFEPTWSAARGRWAVSRYLCTVLADRGVDAQWCPMPVRALRPSSRRDGLQRLILVARATPLKGGDRFVRLVRELNVEGVIVGVGPMLPQWMALAKRLEARVVSRGALSRAETYAELADADAAVLLPRTRPDGSGAEGLGLVLLEAAAAGVPAIGCATGGVAEAVGPGLVLPDPDDAIAGAASVRSWWSPSRGQEAWEWVRQTHGPERTVAALTTVR